MRIGGYEVERELARGGMGVVFLARSGAGEPVAIKLLLTGGATPAQLVRFRREGEALAALDHPGVLGVREHGVDEGRPFLVMDYLPGRTLKALVEADGPLAEERAVPIARAIAAALVHAHRQGIVHRDLKPANVILRDGQPVLVDFGLALALDPAASRLTETGTVMGSPDFMAPEQARSEKDVGPAADVYALGATLYFLLTGRPPFEGKSTLAILERVAGELPRPPRELRPELSPELEAIVLRCLEKHPADRYPEALALERALAAPHEATRDASPAGTALTALTALAALLAALGLGLLALTWSQHPAPTGGSPASAAARQPDVHPPPQAPADPRRPEDVSALIAKGQAALDADRLAEARAAFDRALDLDPERPLAYRLRAVVWQREGRLQEAIEDYTHVLDLEPEDAEAWVIRAELLLDQGKAKQAEADFTRALELAKSARALYGRALARTWLGRANEAVADLDRCLELEPDDLNGLHARGTLLAQLRRFRGAFRDIERLLLLDPDQPDVVEAREVVLAQLEAGDRLRRQAEDLAKRGQSERALAAYGEAIETDPANPMSYAGRASLLAVALRRPEASLADYARALELDPRNPETRFMRGMAHVQLGQPELALSDFTRAAQLEPEFAAAHAARGDCLVLLGRLDPAVDAYDRALALGHQEASTHKSRGACLDSLGREEEAVAAFDRALEIRPEDADAHFRRAGALLQLERLALAGRDLEQALELGLRPDQAAQAKRHLQRIRSQRPAELPR